MAPVSKKNNNNVSVITKKLQTELQSLIAYGCYDSDSVLKSGTSSKKSDLSKKIGQLYRPSSVPNDDFVSYVELFMQGQGKFKYLFDRDYPVGDISTENSGCNNDPQMLTIPAVLHGLKSRIYVGNDCISMSLLSRKNLKNLCDVSEHTLIRHVKEVEANCKKALALCTADDSPYKNFDGKFPSGTDYNDYLNWIRVKMDSTFGKMDIIDCVDDDDTTLDDIAPTADDITAAKVTKNGNAENDGDEMVANNGTYFKGFFAFALWGYIPPHGGEIYRSALLFTVVDKKSSISKEESRTACKLNASEEKAHIRNLERRGEDQDIKKLSNLMINGRKERQKQRLFKTRISNIEFQLNFNKNRIDEIREELAELKADNDVGDMGTIVELKEELQLVRTEKKGLYRQWKVISQAEESRQNIIDIASDDVTYNEISVLGVTEITPVEPYPSESPFSDMTMSSISTKRVLPDSGLQHSRKKLSFTDAALVHTNSGIAGGDVRPTAGSSSDSCVSSTPNNPERRR